MDIGRPGGQTIDHHHRVGILKPRGRIHSGKHWMFGANRKLDRPVLHDRNAPLINQIAKAAKGFRRARTALGNDHRVLGIGQNVCGRLNRCLRRRDRNRLHTQRPVNLVTRARFAQNFTRQADIGWPLRHGRCNGISTIHHIRHLLREFKLIFPFRAFAHQGCLIAHFLAPANRHGACTQTSLFHHRGAARHQNDRDMFGRGIDRANRTVRKPDVGVCHHGLCLAGRKVVTMCHAHRRIFVRHDQRVRQVNILCRRLGQAFDDRREVGPGIGKDVINPDGLHAGQNSPTGGQGDLTGFFLLVAFHQTPLAFSLNISIIEI